MYRENEDIAISFKDDLDDPYINNDQREMIEINFEIRETIKAK